MSKNFLRRSEQTKAKKDKGSANKPKAKPKPKRTSVTTTRLAFRYKQFLQRRKELEARRIAKERAYIAAGRKPESKYITEENVGLCRFLAVLIPLIFFFNAWDITNGFRNKVPLEIPVAQWALLGVWLACLKPSFPDRRYPKYDKYLIDNAGPITDADLAKFDGWTDKDFDKSETVKDDQAHEVI